MGAYPQGVDWNNDGKQDVVAGDASGRVWLFLNEGTPREPRLRAGVELRSDGKPILGVSPRYEKGKDGQYALVPNTKDVMGIYSKIHVADWDADGRLDVLVGQDGPGNHDLVLYRNVGTRERPVLSKPTPITLPDPKMPRPSPYWVDWDGDGKPDLLCGTETATVVFFRNIGEPGAPKFAKGESLPLNAEGFGNGYRCRIHVVDWNNDGKKDLLVGNFCSQGRAAGGNIWLFLAR